jgi:hypothetical protein
MAKKKKKGRTNGKRGAKRTVNPTPRPPTRRRSSSRRRRNNPGLGLAIGGALLGIGSAAAVYGGLAFTSLTSTQKSLIGAGAGVVGGGLLMMANPELGIGVAAGLVGVAAAAATITEITNMQAASTTAPTTTQNAINGTLDAPFQLQRNASAMNTRHSLMRRGVLR